MKFVSVTEVQINFAVSFKGATKKTCFSSFLDDGKIFPSLRAIA